jgi:nucleotide-binding universal stress UspA family protein
MKHRGRPARRPFIFSSVTDGRARAGLRRARCRPAALLGNRDAIYAGDVASAVATIDFEAYRRQQQETAAAILDKAKAEAASAGVSADTVYIAEMRPAEAIVGVAKERDCALIVMASHGWRGLGRLFLGSQTIERRSI